MPRLAQQDLFVRAVVEVFGLTVHSTVHVALPPPATSSRPLFYPLLLALTY